MSSQQQPRKRGSSSCPAKDKHVDSKSRKRRRGKDPLIPPTLGELNHESRSSTWTPKWTRLDATQPEALARRLACGRTHDARSLLEQTRLFHFDGIDDLPAKEGLPQPCRGLQADHRGERVFILDTYMRRGKLQADVAPIRKGRGAGKFVLGPCRDARGSDLENIGSGYLLSVGAGGRPELRLRSPDAEPPCTGVGPAVAASLGAHRRPRA